MDRERVSTTVRSASNQQQNALSGEFLRSRELLNVHLDLMSSDIADFRSKLRYSRVLCVCMEDTKTAIENTIWTVQPADSICVSMAVTSRDRTTFAQGLLKKLGDIHVLQAAATYVGFWIGDALTLLAYPRNKPSRWSYYNLPCRF